LVAKTDGTILRPHPRCLANFVENIEVKKNVGCAVVVKAGGVLAVKYR
jgi:hypothetical protein